MRRSKEPVGEVIKVDQYERILIDGDGYCIVNSIRKSLLETHQIKIGKTEILANIKTTFQCNIGEYVGYIHDTMDQ